MLKPSQPTQTINTKTPKISLGRFMMSYHPITPYIITYKHDITLVYISYICRYKVIKAFDMLIGSYEFNFFLKLCYKVVHLP